MCCLPRYNGLNYRCWLKDHISLPLRLDVSPTRLAFPSNKLSIMVAKAVLASLSLVVSVTAGPVMQGHGSRIPFDNRRSLVDSEGWFDNDKAVQQVIRDHK